MPNLRKSVQSALGHGPIKGTKNAKVPAYTVKGHKADGKVKVGYATRKKVKPKMLGRDKGDWRKVGDVYKQRRFTFDQRQNFRAKRAPTFGGPKDGRPTR